MMVKERKKWRAIICITHDVILFLSKQNLYFRGHREYFDSKKQGNFLESVKLIAKYNPVMNEHLSDINACQHTFLRLYKTVNLTSGEESEKYYSEKRKTKEATYFSILLDSTPAVFHIDQMAFVVRCVKVWESEAKIKVSVLLPTARENDQIHY